MVSDMKIGALAPWFGSNRLLAGEVGALLEGCVWVAIPFAGGMCEVPHIGARTILVNDLHRHVINLARVVSDDSLRPQLVRRLARKAFHPETLTSAQQWCKANDIGDARNFEPSLPAAEHYFVCCWMNRSGKCGQGANDCGGGEFSATKPALRWNANGGDSAVRYFSALRSLVPFSRSLKRCTFDTIDGFDFLARCEDKQSHGIYADPPFPGVGRRYRYNAGNTDAAELAWHTRLRDALARFAKTRVVCRFYDHPLIRELYPETRWTWKRLKGRTQANAEAPELLLINGPAIGGDLFP
jgi:DNA adenine methylase